MKTEIIISIIVVIVTVTSTVQSAKILGYALAPGRSHFIIHDALLRGLAERGHEVTVVGAFPRPKETFPANYTYIYLDMADDLKTELEEAKKGMLQNAMDKQSNTFNWRTMTQLHAINVGYLKHPLLEKLKREAQFDLVVLGWFMNDFTIGIGAHFKCPIVVITGAPAFKAIRDMIANPSNPAYDEFPMFPVKGAMTFRQRLLNHLLFGIEFVALNFFEYFVFEPTYAAHFPSPEYPTFTEAKKNISLVMVSTHFSQSAPIAALPALLEVSGIQIKKKPSPLPADIQQFLDGATDGAVFFSFGSNIDSTYMSEDKRRIVMKVLGKLKQRVLWKWEDDKLPGKPDNVMIGKWLPQDDVLAHPNVRLFISHCGKGSVNEARYHGVPILAMPIFGDQPSNAESIVKEGWAVMLQFGDLTEESLEQALKEALGNPKYRQVVKTEADLYKDRPQHPLDTALYWTEYVLRHNGAKHMQSQAVHLNWFQRNSLDVLAVLAVLAWISWRLFVWTVKLLFRKCFGGGKKVDAAAASKKKKRQ